MKPCKIWIEQCKTARGLEDDFGTANAFTYLIGEKFLNFLNVAEADSEFRAEIPAFVAEIKTIFEPWQLVSLMERQRVLHSSVAELLLLDRASEWLWDEAKRPMRVRWKESARVATLVNAHTNQCFTNCYRAKKRLEDYKEALIVRGTIILRVDNGASVSLHVWLEKNGWIIDPTLVLDRRKGDRSTHTPKRKFEKLPKVLRCSDGLLIPLGDFLAD